MLFGNMTIEQNELVIGGVNTRKLVDQFGSPLYVYDASLIKNNLSDYLQGFQSVLFQTTVAYASKAFLTKAMARLIASYSMALDVVSIGELFTAKAADFPMDQILVHGNNKSPDELKYYIQQKVGLIVVDNVQELDALIDLANQLKTTVRTLFRVNPGIEAHTHEYIITAKHNSKFGESIYDDRKLDEIMRKYQGQSRVILDGFHCHIGSQVFDMESYVKTIEVMSSFINKIERKYQTKVKTLNLGGGFGVFYTKEDTQLDIALITKTIVRAVEEKVLCGELSITNLMIEPGRSIVANAGTTLYTVGYTKTTYGNQNYVFVDGGMSDNIRPALYQAKYDACIATKMADKRTIRYTVAGKLCESGDVLIKDIKLPEVTNGDILAVCSTGAYTYSMSSNYNRMMRPAVVFVEDGETTVVVERETFDDLIRNDK